MIKYTNLFIFLLVTTLSLSSVYALDVGTGGVIGLDLTPPLPTFNNNTAFVNSTNNWVTNEGVLDNVADIEHNWLSNLLWSVAGHIIDTNFNMMGYNIINATNISAEYFLGNGSQLTGLPIPDVNKTYVDNNFYLSSNPFSFYNSSTLKEINFENEPNNNSEGILVLDGVGDYVNLNVGGTTALHEGKSQHTINIWTKFSGATTNGKLTLFGVTGGGMYLRSIGTNTLTYYYKNSSGNSCGAKTLISNAGLRDGTWHMVSVVVNSSGHAFGYFDGVFDGSGSSTCVWDNLYDDTDSYGLGRYSSIYNNGSIDDVQIFDRALTQAEITNIYNLNRSDYDGSTEGLVASYSFDTLSPIDESGNGNDGTLIGDAYIYDDTPNFTASSVFMDFNSFNINNINAYFTDIILSESLITLDNVKFSQGIGLDISNTFNGTDNIINAELGTPNIYWTNFGEYIFDNMVKIANAYYLPTADGNDGEVITANGDGTSDFKPITMMHPITLTTYDAEPTRGAETNIHGGLDNLVMTQPLNSVPTNIVVTKGTGKVMIMINAGSDFSGSLTITGESIDRNTGASTPADTDVITISELSSDTSTTDGNGNTVHNLVRGYSSSKWFTGSITLSTSDLTLTDVDVYHVSFEQFNDVENITLNTFDVNLYTTNVAGEFDSYLYKVADGDNRMNVTTVADLHIGTDGETALANKYWRLRRGNLDEFINGSHSGIFIDTHYSNSPAYIEDVTQKIWATQTI